MGENKKAARLQVILDPATLIRIDDYRSQRRFAGDVSARASSKSDAIRTLIRLALSETLPPKHIDIINRMHREQLFRRHEEPSLIKRYGDNLDRAHLALEQSEIDAIDRYRVYANLCGSKINSRAEAVRFLLEIALEGKIPDSHMTILNRIARDEPRIRERAQQIWQQEGANLNESEEIAKQRWFRAKVDILSEDDREIETPKAPVERRTQHGPEMFDVVTSVPYVPKPVEPSAVGNTNDEPKRPEADRTGASGRASEPQQ